MPYAPVIRVRPTGDLLFVSGATALPLYHQHPHEHDMENLTRCLGAAGATWRDVVRADVFVTDMRDQDAIGEVMGPYFAASCRHRRSCRSPSSSTRAVGAGHARPGRDMSRPDR